MLIINNITKGKAIERIKSELAGRVKDFVSEGKLVEAQRIEQRTKFDIEMLNEIGFCKGIENYSRHLSGRQAGDPAPTLLDYLSQDASTAGLSSTWRLQSWIGFITGLYFSSIVGFQIPLLTILLLRSGVIDRAVIFENRRALWFISLLFGAIVSPPDPLSLFLVGGPMLILLELSLIFDRIFFKE